MSAVPRRLDASRSWLARLTRVQSMTLAWLVVAAICAAWSIHERLPYGFAGHGSPDKVASEFVTNGTALAPPLVMMIIALGAAVVAGTRRRVLGGGADVVLLLVAVVSIVGIAGEPTFGPGFRPAHLKLDQDVLRIAALAVTLGLLATSAQELMHRMRRSSPRA